MIKHLKKKKMAWLVTGCSQVKLEHPCVPVLISDLSPVTGFKLSCVKQTEKSMLDFVREVMELLFAN